VNNHSLNKGVLKMETNNDFTVHGFYTISNAGGIEVELNDSGDGVRYRFSGDPEIMEAEIIYGPNEDDPAGDFIAGFMHGDTFYPLNEFMRVNF